MNAATTKVYWSFYQMMAFLPVDRTTFVVQGENVGKQQDSSFDSLPWDENCLNGGIWWKKIYERV